MKHPGIILLLLWQLVFVSACSLAIKPHPQAVPAGAEAVHARLAAFRPLAEEALALRAETIKAGQRLLAEKGRGKVLSGDDLALLNRGMQQHLALRNKLQQTSHAYEPWLEISGSALQEAGITRQQQQQGVAMSLAAALLLYDNYLLAVSLFDDDPDLRRLLNQSDPAYAIRQAELNRISDDYASERNRRTVRKAIEFYRRHNEALHEAARQDPDLDYVVTLIDQSPSYRRIEDGTLFDSVGRQLDLFGTSAVDSLVAFEQKGVGLVSMVFGNAVGLVETRHGKLQHRPELNVSLRHTLQAGDILLEKTPFRLTDKLIPGYWGHAAIWVGSEEELQALGIWDDPLVQPHQKEIRSGRQIVEALRSGVEINPLEQFMNIDSLGILRQTGADRAKVVLRALRELGKPYDFNFEVESKQGVYCSKLVYLAYGDLAWPTRSSLGRTTFTPDDVAALAVNDQALQLIAFYHDGQKVDKRPREVLAKLMGRNLQQDTQEEKQAAKTP